MAFNEVNNYGLIDGLIKQVLDLIANLTAGITNLVGKVLDQLTNKLSEVLDQGNQLITTTTSLLQGLLDTLLGEIKNLVDGATAGGLDVTSCGVGAAVEGLKAIVDSVIQKVTVCVNTQIDIAKKLVESISAEVKIILDMPQQYIDKLKDCGSSITCILKLISELPLALPKIISQVDKIVDAAIATLSSTLSNITGCALGIVDQAIIDLTAAAKKVIDCLKGLTGIRHIDGRVQF